MNEVSVVEYYEYHNVEDLLRAISYGGSLYRLFMNGVYAFRGHASDKYKLIPSALRLESKKHFNQIALCGENDNSEDLE